MPSDVTGILVVDKPRGWTSHDVVARVRRLANQKRVGHAGTLDPLATGVLAVLLGRATRLADVVQTGRKVYRATVSLGAATETDDAEGTVIERRPTVALSRESIETALDRFRGEIMQQPPAFSALKVAGQRAYAVARRGEQVDLVPRPVTIDSLAAVQFDDTTIVLDVTCSKGTYIRALARDLARALGTVGHLSGLIRTAVGPFSIDEAWTLDDLAARGLVMALQPASRALPDAPTVAVSESDAERLRQGQPLPLGSALSAPARETVASNSRAVWIVEHDGRAVCLANRSSGVLRPRLVL